MIISITKDEADTILYALQYQKFDIEDRYDESARHHHDQVLDDIEAVTSYIRRVLDAHEDRE